MPTPLSIPEPSPTRLVVVVRTDAPLASVEAGRLLTALDRAFRSWVWARFRRRGVGLEIVDTGTGSWWVVLTAAKDAYELLNTEPGLVGLFVADINVSMKALTEADPKQIPRYIRDLLRHLGGVGKRTAAEAIELVSIVRVSLDPEAYELVIRPDTSGAEAPSKAKRSANLAVPHVSEEIATRLEERVVTGDLPARLYHIDGVWYARPKGMHDIMLPLNLQSYIFEAPVDRRDFMIRGQLKRSKEGYPIAIHADSLRPDRRAKWDRSFEDEVAELLRRNDDTDPPPQLPAPSKP